MNTKTTKSKVTAFKNEQAIAIQKAGPPEGFGKAINDYYHHYISVADTKVAAILASDFAALTFVIQQTYTYGLAMFINYAAILLWVVSATLSAIALFPRLERNKLQQGIIYWEEVRLHKSAEEYFTVLKKISAQDVEKAYADQNYLLSHVLYKKNSSLRWSLGSSFIAILFSFGAYITNLIS